MFYSVLNTPLPPALSVRTSQIELLQLLEQMIDLLDKAILVIHIKLHRFKESFKTQLNQGSFNIAYYEKSCFS